MRKEGARNEIIRTLKANPDGLTADQILQRMNPKRKKYISNARHISKLIRGMKGIRKGDVRERLSDTLNQYGTTTYKVNRYYYDEEGAEI